MWDFTMRLILRDMKSTFWRKKRKEICTLEEKHESNQLTLTKQRKIKWCLGCVFGSVHFLSGFRCQLKIAERWIDACRSMYCNADTRVFLLFGDKWMHDIHFACQLELRKPIPKMLNTEHDMIWFGLVVCMVLRAGIGICLNMTRKNVEMLSFCHWEIWSQKSKQIGPSHKTPADFFVLFVRLFLIFLLRF